MRKRTSLPLTLRKSSYSPIGHDSWQGVQRLTWILLGPQALAFSALTFTAYYVLQRIAPVLQVFVTGHLGSVIELAVLLGAAAFCLRPEEMRAAWRLAGLPKPFFALLGAILPALVSAMVLLAAYLPQRAEWAAQNYGRFRPPTFFPEGVHFDPLWLLLIVAALAEEFVFRGILQQEFVERYGLFRGLALVGLVWGAFHFPGDHYSSPSDLLAVVQLFSRIAICLTMGFALSWLTLRSGSIWPATLAHALSNMLFYAGFYVVPFGYVLRIAMWGLLAFLLFKRFPLREQMATTGKDTTPERVADADGIAEV
jgi:membrane protease YdiL (CAAX protease family)